MTSFPSRPITGAAKSRPCSECVSALLASVTSVAEARLAAAGGADIIDCKDPARGALGGLPVSVIGEIRRALPPELPVSATIGDLKPDPEVIAPIVAEVAATGVDYVKVGVFPGGDAKAAISDLGRLQIGKARLVGVLLADLQPDLSLIRDMAEAGFAGVLMDTAGKIKGGLVDILGERQLGWFIADVHRHGMIAGLAGSLRARDIPPLLQLAPDILGFRGALCEGHRRGEKIDLAALSAIRRAIPRSTTPAHIPTSRLPEIAQ